MRRRRGALAAGLLIALALAGCGGDDADETGGAASGEEGPDANPEFSAELQEVIAAAEEEGTLLLNWGADIASDDQFAEWVEGFQAFYGIDVDVENVPNPNLFAATGQMIGEFEAGRPSSSDVAIGTENQVFELQQAGVIEPTDWSDFSELPDEVLQADGAAVSISTHLFGITYNADAVAEDDVPHSMEDLLAAAESYSVAAPARGQNFDILAGGGFWGPERTLEFAREFSAAASAIAECSDAPRVASGEFDMLGLDCGLNFVEKLQVDGAPVEWVPAEDAAMMIHLYVGVPKHAEHPNLAQLWTNYLLTREAQDILYEHQFVDNHQVEGSNMAEVIAGYEEDGIDFTLVDVAYTDANKDAFTDVAVELDTIFTSED